MIGCQHNSGKQVAAFQPAMSKTVVGNSASPHCSLGGPLGINVDEEIKASLNAVKTICEVLVELSIEQQKQVLQSVKILLGLSEV